jgi:gamma-glutamylcysteine synthetase
VELRCTDTVPPVYALALAAFVEGLFYDQDSLEHAAALTQHWNFGERTETWHNAHRSALAGATPDGKRLLDYARELLQIARPSAASDFYMEPLRELLNDGRSLAERTAAEIERSGGATDIQAVLAPYCCAYCP